MSSMIEESNTYIIQQLYEILQILMIQNNEISTIQQPFEQEKKQFPLQEQTTSPANSILCPFRIITGHWLTISRPQYKRTCGISSLVSLWNFQFSRLGLGNKQPISIEQAMLKLNLIGSGSIQESFRKKFKKTAELTEKNQNLNEQKQAGGDDLQCGNLNKNLHEYIDSVDFGVFTGNEALMKWYRLLCRIYGGSGTSYIFYKTNSQRSKYKDQLSAKRALIEGLNSNGKICFIYHAYDHYFCPVGYEFTPQQPAADGQDTFQSSSVTLEDNLCVLVGQSSKMFSCFHSFNWSDIQLDLTTYLPKRFNIRRPKEGVTTVNTKEGSVANTNTINCIMAFQKLRD